MTRKRKKHAPLEKQVEDRFDAVEEGKISDRIAFLVDPFLWNLDESHGGFASGIVAIACTAWNASLLKASKRQAMIDEFTATLNSMSRGVEGKLLVQNLIDDFMEQKLEKFPDDRRFITSYKVTPNKDGFKLTIASVDTDNQPKSQT